MNLESGELTVAYNTDWLVYAVRNLNCTLDETLAILEREPGASATRVTIGIMKNGRVTKKQHVTLREKSHAWFGALEERENGNILCAFRGFEYLYELGRSSDGEFACINGYNLPAQFKYMTIAKWLTTESVIVALDDRSLREYQFSDNCLEELRQINLGPNPNNILFDKWQTCLLAEDYLDSQSIIASFTMDGDRLNRSNMEFTGLESNEVDIRTWTFSRKGNIVIYDWKSDSLLDFECS